MADLGMNKWQDQEINSNDFDLRSKAETSQWVVDEVRSRLLAATAGKRSEGNTGNTEEDKSLWLQISIHCSGAKEFSQPTFSL